VIGLATREMDLLQLRPVRASVDPALETAIPAAAPPNISSIRLVGVGETLETTMIGQGEKARRWSNKVVA
jgi:hypothetical protein